LQFQPGIFLFQPDIFPLQSALVLFLYHSMQIIQQRLIGRLLWCHGWPMIPQILDGFHYVAPSWNHMQVLDFLEQILGSASALSTREAQGFCKLARLVQKPHTFVDSPTSPHASDASDAPNARHCQCDVYTGRINTEWPLSSWRWFGITYYPSTRQG
jgi:hypothetical protein